MASIQEAIRTDEKIKSRSSRNKRLKLGIPSAQEETTESAFDALQEKQPRGIKKAIVSHKSDPMIFMYDAQGRRREVPEGSVRVCLTEGLFLECPLCGGEHEGNDANACPGLPRVQYRRCPVCGKKIYDDRAVPEAMATDEPGLIPTDLPSTPEARTQATWEAHMVAYHEQAARRAGLMTADSARR